MPGLRGDASPAYEGCQFEMEFTLLLDWIDLLESGELLQARSVLHSYQSNAHCCLGVERIAKGLEEQDRRYYLYPADGEDMSEDLENACVNLNDEELATFPEIAGWLRDNVRPVL